MLKELSKIQFIIKILYNQILIQKKKILIQTFFSKEKIYIYIILKSTEFNYIILYNNLNNKKYHELMTSFNKKYNFNIIFIILYIINSARLNLQKYYKNIYFFLVALARAIIK